MRTNCKHGDVKVVQGGRWLKDQELLHFPGELSSYNIARQCHNVVARLYLLISQNL